MQLASGSTTEESATSIINCQWVLNELGLLVLLSQSWWDVDRIHLVQVLGENHSSPILWVVWPCQCLGHSSMVLLSWFLHSFCPSSLTIRCVLDRVIQVYYLGLSFHMQPFYLRGIPSELSWVILLFKAFVVWGPFMMFLWCLVQSEGNKGEFTQKYPRLRPRDWRQGSSIFITWLCIFLAWSLQHGCKLLTWRLRTQTGQSRSLHLCKSKMEGRIPSLHCTDWSRKWQASLDSKGWQVCVLMKDTQEFVIYNPPGCTNQSFLEK